MLDIPTLDFFQLLFGVCGLLFAFWPLMFLSALKGRGSLLRNLLSAWYFILIVRVFLFFSPEPAISFLIPEPSSTIVFFAIGAVLIGLQYGGKSWRRNLLRRKTGKAKNIEDLLELTPREFEDMVVELHQVFGHQAKRTGGTGDHGVDVVVQTKQGEKCVIQCKRWRGSVGEPVIRDFYGVMHHEKADQGIVITTGKFTRPAREWAKGKPLALYDGNEFMKLWERAQAKRNTTKVTTTAH